MFINFGYLLRITHAVRILGVTDILMHYALYLAIMLDLKVSLVVIHDEVEVILTLTLALEVAMALA